MGVNPDCDTELERVYGELEALSAEGHSRDQSLTTLRATVDELVTAVDTLAEQVSDKC